MRQTDVNESRLASCLTTVHNNFLSGFPIINNETLLSTICVKIESIDEFTYPLKVDLQCVQKSFGPNTHATLIGNSCEANGTKISLTF